MIESVLCLYVFIYLFIYNIDNHLPSIPQLDPNPVVTTLGKLKPNISNTNLFGFFPRYTLYILLATT